MTETFEPEAPRPDTSRFVLEGRADGFELTLTELTASLGADTELIIELVEFGVLDPVGETRDDWRFGADNLRRGRTAWRLVRDLGINSAGAALAVDLLERIAELERRLGR